MLGYRIRVEYNLWKRSLGISDNFHWLYEERAQTVGRLTHSLLLRKYSYMYTYTKLYSEIQFIFWLLRMVVGRFEWAKCENQYGNIRNGSYEWICEFMDDNNFVIYQMPFSNILKSDAKEIIKIRRSSEVSFSNIILKMNERNCNDIRKIKWRSRLDLIQYEHLMMIFIMKICA